MRNTPSLIDEIVTINSYSRAANRSRYTVPGSRSAPLRVRGGGESGFAHAQLRRRVPDSTRGQVLRSGITLQRVFVAFYEFNRNIGGKAGRFCCNSRSRSEGDHI